jgi:hypothetical protein
MITAGLTTSFKEQLLLGVHDFSADVLKIALYGSAANLGPDTTIYSSTDEVSSAGYSAGGAVLLNVTVSSGLQTGYISFTNPIWLATTFTVRGALMYNYTKANKSIAVLNFGTDQTTLGQNFEIQLPANQPETAVIRIL